MGPLLSNKSSNRSQITLVNNEEIISDDSQVAETMNIYFEKSSEISKYYRKSVAIYPQPVTLMMVQ